MLSGNNSFGNNSSPRKNISPRKNNILGKYFACISARCAPMVVRVINILPLGTRVCVQNCDVEKQTIQKVSNFDLGKNTITKYTFDPLTYDSTKKLRQPTRIFSYRHIGPLFNNIGENTSFPEYKLMHNGNTYFLVTGKLEHIVS